MIKDSGDRTEFDSGAVRDMHEGKGRCDLLPLDVVGKYLTTHGSCDKVVMSLDLFTRKDDVTYLHAALDEFLTLREWDKQTLVLEVAVHYEEGAKKYDENNWKKGIPVKCYLDSAIRHYLKWLRGDIDERHDRAFCWNILCAIWTINHKPELNNYGKENNYESN